jgi:predicted dehydrogenase
MHVDMARQVVSAGLHVLIEKPISDRTDGVRDLIETASRRQCLIGVGYILRFHPALEAVKSLIKKGTIGRILSARVKVGTPFDRGRPDYRQIYFARAETGGGIILDGSHEIDYLRWLMQEEVIEVACMFDRLGRMEIETEDTAELLLRFESNALANVHIDYIQRNYSRYSEWIGESGTIRWEYSAGLVETFDEASQDWVRSTYAFERDDLFRRQAANFVAAIEGKERLRVDGEDALKTLQICMAAKRAAIEKCVVQGSAG